ncbi:endolytic transglycosylase MltG [candidate division WOR-3 bacterium]|nr:endolytic transglycosylase MltG [candidate division WOR-3 bacterium]
MSILILFLILSSPNYVYIEVEKGEGAGRIAEKLYESGVIRYPLLFTLWARITGSDKRIKAGRYEFRVPSRIRDVLRKMVRGEVLNIRVTIPEGVTICEVAQRFQYKAGMDSAEFMNLVRDSSLISSFGLNAPSLEGLLFPDTYFVFDSIPATRVIELMTRRFFNVFDSSMQRRMEEIGFTLNQIVTLASIIQLEVKVKEELPLVSSVYHNRLAKGRRLESCPTILFLLPERRDRVFYADLLIDSPYNTYIHTGLPPGAICNPGKEALLAALYPAETDYLYFVAKGDGTHIFSRTYREHTAAKRDLR